MAEDFCGWANPFISTQLDLFFKLFHAVFSRDFTMEKPEPAIPCLMLKSLDDDFNLKGLGTDVKSLASWCDHEVLPGVLAPRLFA